MTAEAPRLNRYLAACGLGSRRGVEALVAEGRVTLDGELATSPGQRVAEGARVTVDGRPVAPQAHAYVLLNKPAGVVTTVGLSQALIATATCCCSPTTAIWPPG